MRERGILFTPHNYTLCDDGSKTQTRRIVKNADYYACLTGDCPHEDRGLCAAEMPVHCPYGIAGDRLYVKEGLERTSIGNRIQYRSDRAPLYDRREWTWQRDTLSPLHMPKWAARLWLEITEIRVERLQDISVTDCKAEGVKIGGEEEGHDFHYMILWESINGPGSWDANPFVWAITFKKTPPLDVRQAEV